MKCRFCEFGRDDVDGGEERKRKMTKDIKFYRKPWRSDNMMRHVKEQHSIRYDEYPKLCVKEKKQYFEKMEDSRPLASMTRNDRSSTIDKEMLVYNISKDIIEVIIRQLLSDYDPDDTEDDMTSTSNTVQQDIFILVDNGETIYYEASWSNKLQFEIIVSYIAVGNSFRQCEKLMLVTKGTTGLGTLGNINIGKVIQTVRYTCAFNMEVIRSVLDHVWAFSISMDGGTKSSVPYLNVRLRFVLQGKLFNIHLGALPMFESHTGENTFLLISKFLDAL